MAAPHSSASPSPGPSNSGSRNRLAESLYAWCRESHPVGHVFTQTDLLAAGVIPNQDVKLLLESAQHLLVKNLFKIHDLRSGGSGGSIGWELVSQERAANYEGLNRDETLVFASIDTSGTAGIWTKTIKARLGLHAKVLERIYKSLESRTLIKPMKSVKYPGRKMFIVAGLQPSEETTGGPWYSDGKLDEGLMQIISDVIEHFVSSKSWKEVEHSDSADDPIRSKRHQIKGKSKMARIDDDQPRSVSPELHKSRHRTPALKSYLPFDAGYDGYPTLQDVTFHIMQSKVSATILPENAIAQLLEVMVYDNRLFRIKRSIKPDEVKDELGPKTITMYRCFKTQADLAAHRQLARRAASESKTTQMAARRQLELEDIGRGGSSEVPCLKCPVFDLCGDGGPVNAVTCPYFDEWYVKNAEADLDAGDPWPGSEQFISDGKARNAQRLEAMKPPAPAKIDRETVDLT